MKGLVGWLGSGMLALCAVPQVVHTVGHWDASGLSWGFLGLWAGGEVLMLSYLGLLRSRDLVLWFNYLLNTILTLILVAVKVDNFFG